MSISIPNVPFLPGVPTVFRAASAITTVPQVLLNSDAIFNLLNLFNVQWGIFDDSGQAVLIADSVLAMEFSGEYKISDYPIEDGDFRSYNKTQVPFDIKFTFGKSGSVSDRNYFLQSIDDLCASTELVNVVTPEQTYSSANLVRRGYVRTRSNGGSSLIYIDVYAREVRIAPNDAYTKTVDPNAQDPKVNGTVQPTDETPPANNSVSSTVNNSNLSDSSLNSHGDIAGAQTQLNRLNTTPAAPSVSTNPTNLQEPLGLDTSGTTNLETPAAIYSQVTATGTVQNIAGYPLSQDSAGNYVPYARPDLPNVNISQQVSGGTTLYASNPAPPVALANQTVGPYSINLGVAR